MSLQEFFDMGGYGFYIWGSYIICAVIFIGLFVSAKMQRNRLLNQLRRRYRRQNKLNENNKTQTT